MAQATGKWNTEVVITRERPKVDYENLPDRPQDLPEYSWLAELYQEYQKLEAEWQEKKAREEQIRQVIAEDAPKLRVTFESDDEAIQAGLVARARIEMAEKELKLARELAQQAGDKFGEARTEFNRRWSHYTYARDGIEEYQAMTKARSGGVMVEGDLMVLSELRSQLERLLT